jgi:hypothetical protein
VIGHTKILDIGTTFDVQLTQDSDRFVVLLRQVSLFNVEVKFIGGGKLEYQKKTTNHLY